MQLPRQVTGPLCRHPAHPLPGGAWLKVGRAERGKREGRAAPGPRGRQRRGTEGRPDRRSQSPRENRWKGYFFLSPQLRRRKKWLQAKRLLIYTHTPELLGRPISSHAGTKGERASEQGAGRQNWGSAEEPRAGRPLPPRPPPGPRCPLPAARALTAGDPGAASPPDRPRRQPGASPPPPPAAPRRRRRRLPPSVSAETPPPSAAASRAAGHVTAPRDRRLPERTRGGWCRPLRAGERGSERRGARARGAVSSLPRAARSAPATATAPGGSQVLAASGVFTRDRVRGCQRGPEVDIRPTPRRRSPGAAREHTAACTMSQRGSRGNSHSSTSGGVAAVTAVLPPVAFREKRIRSVI